MSNLTMQQRIEELRKRRNKAMLGGGADKLDKQRKQGKLTARERIEAMVDPGSFEETGLFAEHRSDSVRHGRQKLSGRWGHNRRRFD